MTDTTIWLKALSELDLVGARRRLASYHPAIDSVPTEIAILGAATEGQRLARICASHGIRVQAIVDDSPQRQGSFIEGQCVKSVTELDELDRRIPIIIASHLTLAPYKKLKAKGFRNVSPFAALQILHEDLFPPHMFHEGWLEDLIDSRNHYVSLFGRLDDELSRRTLNAVLGYRQTLVPDILEQITTAWEEVYLPSGLFALARDETYVDGGSFDGDTIRMFIDRTGGHFKKVIGFEPDPATFNQLVKNFANEPRVLAVNAGLWSSTEVLNFNDDAGRASILGSEGKTRVKVVTLDEILNGDACSYIKMNIEGAELEALKGASRTIQEHIPKLAISAYHRPSDLFKVANLVDEIYPGYRLHLRQHCGGLVETVLYAIPGKHILSS